MPALRLRAWEKWQAAAGPWRGWAMCPAMLAPEQELPPDPAGPDHRARAIAEQLATSLVGVPSTALIVDLEPVVGVHIAADLNHRALANAVIIVARWPYREAILPVGGLISSMIDRSMSLTPDVQPNVVFVLDGERRKSVRRRSPTDPRADNRYDLAVADLPSLTTLRAAGIERIVKLASA